MYQEAAMFEELSGVLERHAAVVGARSERGILLLKKAENARLNLKAPEIAAEAYERILMDTSADFETTRAALAGILGVRARRVDLERVRRILDDRVRFAAGSTAEAGLLTLRAELLQSRLDGEAGRADFEAAVKLDKSHGKAQLALGLMAAEQGNNTVALTHFQQVLAADSGQFEVDDIIRLQSSLRRVLGRMNRTAEEAAYVERIAERFPEYAEFVRSGGGRNDGWKTVSFQTDPQSALPASLTLTDRWARPVRYLRVSVTDRCNYRCRYCMPEDEWSASRREDILTLEEIARVVRLLALHGLEKVRITGGEPLLRKNICQLVSWIAATPGIRTVAMTTNGHLLERYAQELFDAGLSRLNVSLDTFDAQAFRELTGGGDLERVLDGLTVARTVGFDDIRINAVLTQPPEQLGLEGFVKRCWREGWTPRFIEVMPIGGLPYQVEGRRVTSSDVWTYLEERLDLNSEFESGASSDGPASYKTVASGPLRELSGDH